MVIGYTSFHLFFDSTEVSNYVSDIVLKGKLEIKEEVFINEEGAEDSVEKSIFTPTYSSDSSVVKGIAIGVKWACVINCLAICFILWRDSEREKKEKWDKMRGTRRITELDLQKTN